MEHVFIDEETGESIVRPVSSSPPVNNAETGEPEIGGLKIGMKRRRVPFQIPREVKDQLNTLEKEKRKKRRQEKPGKGRRRSDREDEKFIDVEPVSGTSFAQTNPIFLFLVAIVYFRWILALFTIFEVVFHIWTHHKNKRLKNTNVFFRSPFHGVTSEFCALCQNENCMDKVGKIQEIRMHKFLRQCNYMKRAVT
ncbi:uncharacterized protein [Venturia canescens]|uniref:uncharacterized protein n=1 Tax=Venturia canescens TaxID=32260 RepID=UPI001C9C0F45|nr:uncharacterized protein LOC122417158 [Venturia canescens]XP_043286391.1 uncharacterized protein LOC122417158 [Venturia canescens]XP_043286393.1 uncharacterized protein LOC122417158 [Venturia canescens]XP_043286394.1 uncharacterized protein LOC122417158 [Venturia canescens]